MTTPDTSRPCPPPCVHPDDIISNGQVREMVRDGKPITRATLIAWRRDRGFPDPFKTLPGGIELWDARAVAAWMLGQRGA